jgi:hypothetical protein
VKTQRSLASGWSCQENLGVEGKGVGTEID